MKEEIGPAFQHGGICAHSAARLIDPPAAGRVGLRRADAAPSTNSCRCARAVFQFWEFISGPVDLKGISA
jgi:hypothetical protein